VVQSKADDLPGVVDTVVPEPAVNRQWAKGKAFVKGWKRRDKGFPYYAPTAKYTHLMIEIQI
jgi:hypothetical protein